VFRLGLWDGVGDGTMHPAVTGRLGIINACSAANRMAVFHDTIHDHSLDALIITETWIKDTAPDAIQLT